MPIYEFYCRDCNTIFSFLSRSVDTRKRPLCPKCRKRELDRQVSLFAATGRAKSDDGGDVGGVEDSRIERAISSLAGEAESIDENDPRQAAKLMRKFSRMTGVDLGKGMETALNRMEAGEDPEQIEQEMGDALEDEEPFALGEEGKRRGARKRRGSPARDTTLYEL